LLIWEAASWLFVRKPKLKYKLLRELEQWNKIILMLANLFGFTGSCVCVTFHGELVNQDTVKWSLHSVHAKHLPKKRNSVGNLILEYEAAKNSDGYQVMICDNGVDSSYRMLIFGIDKRLHHFPRSTTWFLDGTFNIATSLFTQLYVIRTPLDNPSVICVWSTRTNRHMRSSPQPGSV